MGFQPDVGATVVVAKLTDLGTKYLLTDPDRFEIKSFAAYDDEIDYSLWNEDHANGNNYYGAAIEALHLLEPIKSSTWQCKYPLIRDFPRDLVRMPYINIDNPDLTLTSLNDDDDIRGEVLNLPGVRSLEMLIYDNTIFDTSNGSTPLDNQWAGSYLSRPGGWGTPSVTNIKVDNKGNFTININARIVTSDKVCVYTLSEKSTGVTTSGLIRVTKNNDFSFNQINT